jgi:hypothetical protein
MSTAAAIPTRQLHPLVTLDYRVRMVSMVVVGLIPLFHFRGRPPLPALVGMAFTAFLWPQIAYLIAKNSRDTRRAEFRNLLLDSFLVGGWTAALSFSLFPGAVMVAALNSANLSVGGLRQAAKGLAAILLGMVVVGFPLGFEVHPESSLPTALFCIVGILTVTTIFGYYGHLQTKRVRQAKNSRGASRSMSCRPATREIPVIALTAHAMAGDEKKAREAGCDDFDTKPVEFARLLSKIEGLLQKRKAG